MSELKPPEDDEGGEGWIVSFADLMTLLFAFFVVLYGLKPEGETKAILGVVSSIREAFIEIPDEIPEEEKDGPILQGTAVFSYFKADTLRRPIMKKFRRSENVVNVVNKDMLQIQELIRAITPPTETQNEDQQDAGAKAIAVYPTPNGFNVRIMSSHFYEPGSYRVKRSSLEELRKISTLLKQINRRVEVTGHTDSIPREGPIGNWELSALRASYIGKFMRDEVGFPETQLSVSGYADMRPVASNDSPEGRKLNRRVEIQVQYD